MRRVKESTLKNYGTFNEQYVGFGNLYLNSEEVNGLVATGYLNSTQTSNLGEIVDSTTSDAGTVTKYKYLIRWYNKTDGIFPKILQVFRLSCGQLPVNFPTNLAKWIYENYTKHIDTDEPLHIYDSSSGWGGRIIGRVLVRKFTMLVQTLIQITFWMN